MRYSVKTSQTLRWQVESASAFYENFIDNLDVELSVTFVVIAQLKAKVYQDHTIYSEFTLLSVTGSYRFNVKLPVVILGQRALDSLSNIEFDIFNNSVQVRTHRR